MERQILSQKKGRKLAAKAGLTGYLTAFANGDLPHGVFLIWPNALDAYFVRVSKNGSGWTRQFIKDTKKCLFRPKIQRFIPADNDARDAFLDLKAGIKPEVEQILLDKRPAYCYYCGADVTGVNHSEGSCATFSKLREMSSQGTIVSVDDTGGTERLLQLQNDKWVLV